MPKNRNNTRYLVSSSTSKETSFANSQSETKSTLPLNTVLPLLANVPSACIRHCIEVVVRIIGF